MDSTGIGCWDASPASPYAHFLVLHCFLPGTCTGKAIVYDHGSTMELSTSELSLAELSAMAAWQSWKLLRQKAQACGTGRCQYHLVTFPRPATKQPSKLTSATLQALFLLNLRLLVQLTKGLRHLRWQRLEMPYSLQSQNGQLIFCCVQRSASRLANLD